MQAEDSVRHNLKEQKYQAQDESASNIDEGTGNESMNVKAWRDFYKKKSWRQLRHISHLEMGENCKQTIIDKML